MKKILLVIVLLLSIFTLSACNQVENPDGKDPNTPGDNNVNPGAINDLTYLEEYVEQMKSKYNQFTLKYMYTVYFDEERFIFRASNNKFYQYKDDELTEHDLLGTSTSTPGILRYDKDKTTLYYIDLSYRIYTEQSEKVQIHTYNFDTNVRGSFTTVDAIYSFTGKHLITKTDNKLTVYDEKMNSIKEYTDGLYLGFTSHPGTEDEAYSLIASMNNDVCNIDVYLDQLIKAIPLDIDCNYVYNLYSKEKGIHFVLGDQYTESYLYHFDVETKEISKVNTYNSSVSYVIEDDTDVYKGMYAFRLTNDTSVLYNTTFTEEESYVYTMEDILLIGKSFYVTKPGDDYVLNHFDDDSTTEIDSIFLSNSNYTISGDYFIGQIYDGNVFLYLQKVFDEDGNNFLTDVMDFRMIDYSKAVYLDNITKTSYEVKLYSFAIEESILLHTNTFPNMEQGRFQEFFVDNNNHIYVVSGTENLDIIEFDHDGIEIATHKLLGSMNYKGYRILYLVDDNGQLKEVYMS